MLLPRPLSRTSRGNITHIIITNDHYHHHYHFRPGFNEHAAAEAAVLFAQGRAPANLSPAELSHYQVRLLSHLILVKQLINCPNDVSLQAEQAVIAAQQNLLVQSG